MTTYTQLARLPQIVPFDPAVKNAWGPPINSAWNAIEQLAAGNGQIDVTGLTSYSVTVANDATDQARQAMLPFVGTTPGPCTITVPPISRIGWVSNGTTNNIILTAGGAPNLTIPPGYALFYTITGSAVTQVPFSSVDPARFFSSVILGSGSTVYLTIAGGTLIPFVNYNASSTYTQISTGGFRTGGLGLRFVNGNGDVLATFPNGTGPVVYSGTVNAAAFVTTSDARAKSDAREISFDDSFQWVLKARPLTYQMDGRSRAGFIAQDDIANGRAAAVYEVADDGEAYAAGDGFARPGHRLARDYEHDIAYLTKALSGALNAMAEMLTRIDALEAKQRGV